MPRVKGGFRTRRQHKKVIGLAKGYRMSRHLIFTRANQAVLRAGEHAFAGRAKRRRDLRQLWIVRLNAGLDKFGIKYSRFIPALKRANVELNRKMLSELAVKDFGAFEKVVGLVKPHLK